MVAHPGDRAAAVAAGMDRHATARAVSDRARTGGASPQRLWLATGGNWPDALAAGPAVAADRGLLLLVHPTELEGSAATREWLVAQSSQLERVRLLGGLAAISGDVERDVRALVERR